MSLWLSPQCLMKGVSIKQLVQKKQRFPYSAGRHLMSFANMAQTIKTKQAPTYSHCNPELQNLT